MKEKKYWLHRISHFSSISQPLLEQNILTIGFSDFAEDKFIEDVRNNPGVINDYFQEYWNKIPRIRHILKRFISEFKKGDWVIVPGYKTFSIYEIKSEKPFPVKNLKDKKINDWYGNEIIVRNNGKLYRNDELIDLGFYWEVEPIAKNISRKDYADAALTKRLKIRQTNAEITKLKDSIKSALEHFKENRPLILYNEIMNKFIPELLNMIRKTLNPDKFEKLIKFYFERIGATDIVIPPKNHRNEGDADVIATLEALKTIIYVQAKFHDKNTKTHELALIQINKYVDSEEVSDENYNKLAWVISTADDFSSKTKELAIENNIHLFNGEEFAKMLIEEGILNLDL